MINIFNPKYPTKIGLVQITIERALEVLPSKPPQVKKDKQTGQEIISPAHQYPIFFQAKIDGHLIKNNYSLILGPNDPIVDDALRTTTNYEDTDIRQNFCRYVFDNSKFGKVSIHLKKYNRLGRANTKSIATFDLAPLFQQFKQTAEVYHSARLDLISKNGNKQGYIMASFRIIPILSGKSENLQLDLNVPAAMPAKTASNDCKQDRQMEEERSLQSSVQYL